MNLLLLCPKSMEMMEFSVFIDVFGWARDECGCDITVTTCGLQKTVISTFQVPVTMDTTLDQIDPNEYDALAIPGGFREYGFDEEAYEERVLSLICSFDQQHKPIATVCVAALALARSGILKGRKATTYHMKNGIRQKELADLGAVVVNEPVVIDDNVITSYCPMTAPYVAFALLQIMTDEATAIEIQTLMGFDSLM